MYRFLFLLFFLFLNLSVLAQPHAGHNMNSGKADTPSDPSSRSSQSKDDARIAVNVPIEQQTRIGLKVSKVEKRDVVRTIRTIGTVTADETKEYHFHTKINGWVEKVYADYVGRRIRKGEPLFDLYSPDLITTQEEYLEARKQRDPTAQEIAKAAIDRLLLWGVPPSEVNKLKTSGKVKPSVTFVSLADGFIASKKVVNGMYITPDMDLYQIDDLANLWVVVTLYEYDVAAVSVGDEVEIRLPYDPDVVIKGKINYLFPEIEAETRTAKARIEIDNADQKLKPRMFVDVELTKDMGMSLLIPEDAVIDTGTKKIVFVKTGPSSFDPRKITVGPRIGTEVVILSGIKEGEEVVTSAHFLIDAESKLRAVLQTDGATKPGHSGHSSK
jgi:multidrug efflux pump subunit AcrA (membrane-fusion protein)